MGGSAHKATYQQYSPNFPPRPISDGPMRKVNKRLTGGRRWEQVLPTSELQRSSARDGVYNAGPVMESFSSDTVAKLPQPAPPPKADAVSLEGFGSHCFWGKEAEKYLVAEGLALSDLTDPMWVHDIRKADQIAAAVLKWGVAHGASYFCHWFQPMASTARHGQSGQVQHSMFEFDENKRPVWDFKGKHLLRGETDGSSFPTGGLRKTHTAAGYLTIDPLSPMFLRTDCIFVPACFVSYTGLSLDEKTPLHRAEFALSREGARLFGLLGHPIAGLRTNIGLEQELFFVPSSAYYKRPDLMQCDRTVLGNKAALGQEAATHYMAPINTTKSVFACMQEIQRQCYLLGIPLKTRHREVAPNQYEFAPMFGHVIEQTDNNLMAMQIASEVAPTFGLRAIFMEKPFQGVNGSGKHNNWSISTKCGAQLLNPIDLTKKMDGDAKLFPIIMACIVAAVDKYGDLMRMAIATPGNDFRLGGMEAPPAVMSTYLGEDLTNYLKSFVENPEVGEYKAHVSLINLGIPYLPEVFTPAEDRNRTSPFPYGGMRFEFRAVGASQNVSVVNTVLGAIVADQFKAMADRVEGGEAATAVAQDLLKRHMKVVFNGNGYAEEWPAEAEAKGLFVISSNVDAMCCLSAPKNVEMFEGIKVYTAEECAARVSVMLGQYTGLVETECLCMVEMIRQHVLPAVRTAGMTQYVEQLDDAIALLQNDLAAALALDEKEGAAAARTLRLKTMVTVRKLVDSIEAVVPPHLWTLATYHELMFLDQTTE